MLGIAAVLVFAGSFGPPTRAPGGQARAISGSQIELKGAVLDLGVTCPDPETDAGREAKALANLFLRNADVYCEWWEGLGYRSGARCRINKRGGDGPIDLAERMRASGKCE